MGYEPATWRLATTFIAGEPGLSSLHAAQPIQIKETASAGQKGFVATMSKGTPRLPPCNRGVLTPGGSQKSYDVNVPLILDVPVGNDIIEVKCCHRAMRQLLGIQHSVWRTYLAQAAASFSMPVDGDVLDYHGLTEEDLADVAKHPGGSSAKEWCAAWQMDFAKECGDYDPARAANEILLGDLNMKQCWEHEYKEDLSGRGKDVVVYGAPDDFFDAILSAFEHADVVAAEDMSAKTPAGTRVKVLGCVYDVAAWLLHRKEPNLAGWSMALDYMPPSADSEDGLPTRTGKAARCHHTSFRKVQGNPEVWMSYQCYIVTQPRPDGVLSGRVLAYDQQGRPLYGIRVFDPDIPCATAGPLLAGLNLRYLEENIPRIKLFVGGLHGTVWAQYFVDAKTKVNRLIRWAEFWPKVPKGIDTVPAEWRPPEWPRPSPRSAPTPLPAATYEEEELALAIAAAVEPLVPSVRHAGFTQAQWDEANRAIAFDIAAAQASVGLEEGHPVIVAHPCLAEGNTKFTWTPALYGVVHKTPAPGDTTVLVECFHADHYAAKWLRWHPSSAGVPVSSSLPVHVYAVPKGDVLLSSWPGPTKAKPNTVKLTKGGCLAAATVDALQQVVKDDRLCFAEYKNAAAARARNSEAWEKRVADGIMVSTPICRWYAVGAGKKRFHGRVTAIDAGSRLAAVLWDDGEKDVLPYDDLQAVLCSCPGAVLPELLATDHNAGQELLSNTARDERVAPPAPLSVGSS
eukprot:jgi/Mesvir1/17466/Mv08736-RA.1